MLVDLRSHGALPAILFNYDRDECEKILLATAKILEETERKYRETNPTWKKKMASYEERRLAAARMRGKPSKSAKQPGMTKGDLIREAATQECDTFDNFYPDDPLAEFSFADTTKIPRDELDGLLSPLVGSVQPEFIDALRRGLGVHHAGMNRRYRQV